MTNNWTNIESNYNPEPRRGHTGVLYKINIIFLEENI
jgi:hypothetical protein